MASITSSRTAPLAPASTAASHPFTCNSCQVAFRSSELQRAHMHSDWHRYNLKRRVASLPPLASEVFAEKVLNAQATSSAAAAKASFEKSCAACQKTYFSENAFQNHLGSQKHKIRVASLRKGGVARGDDETASVMSSTFSLGEPIETASQVSADATTDDEISEVAKAVGETSIGDGESTTKPHNGTVQSGSESLSRTATKESPSQPIPLNKCLFCNYDSPSLDLNVSHMFKIHGMFIPEKPYLSDLSGLIGYLYEKIAEFHECLFCHKLKGTAAGIQTHMRDKGHCMIAFDDEEDMIEVGQFYDFRSTYSEHDDSDSDMDSEEEGHRRAGGVKLGAKRDGTTKMVISDENGAEVEVSSDDDLGEGQGWETDSDASSLASEDLTAVPLDHTHRFEKLSSHRHHSHANPHPHHHRDGYHSHAHHTHPHAVYHDDYELHLPSGRTAGHRSLARYYRQNLHNYPTPAERIQNRRAIAEGRATSDSDSDSEDDGQRQRRQGRGRDSNRQLVSRANGGLGMLGVSDVKKKEVKAVEKRALRAEQRARKQYQWGVEKKGNSQKHFRVCILSSISPPRALTTFWGAWGSWDTF
ncbi:MAG: hypothetical protein M1819_001765 [Sarea resinae]|nr:MAG: hypothetical protein M1819_001765 [Sarea resinae]